MSLAAPAGCTNAPAPTIEHTGDWRAAVHRFVETNLKHPAWGLSHSVRDYELAKELAAADQVTLDDDVLYAAAYLHDVAAFAPFRKPVVDHQDEAARIVESLLDGTGFPMSKIEAVRGAIRTHMFARDPVGPRPSIFTTRMRSTGSEPSASLASSAWSIPTAAVRTVRRSCRGWNIHWRRSRRASCRRPARRALRNVCQSSSSSCAICALNQRTSARSSSRRRAVVWHLERLGDLDAGAVTVPCAPTPIPNCAKACQTRSQPRAWPAGRDRARMPSRMSS